MNTTPASLDATGHRDPAIQNGRRGHFTRPILIGSAIAFAASGVAATAATADTVKLPDHQRTWQLADGGTATVGSRGERIARVAPLTTAGTTREGFFSVEAYGAVPRGIEGAVLETGYQIGCMASFQGVGIGTSATVGIGGTAGTGGGSLGPNASIGPSITVNIGAGQIADLPLAKKQFQTVAARIKANQVQVKVDGCIGPASARSYTRLSITGKVTDEQNVVYGRVTPL